MDVHGVTVNVESADNGIFRWLRMDYGRFCAARTDRPADLTVTVVPPATELPGCVRGFDGSRVVVTPRSVLVSPAAKDAKVAYYDQVRPYLTASISRQLLAAEGTVMVHGAAVSVEKSAGDHQATVFVGEAGAGKTTMGLSAVAAGARYLANDLVFIRAEAGAARVLSMPQAPLLGPGTQKSLANWYGGWDGMLVPLADDGGDPADIPQYGRGKQLLDPASLPAGPLDAPLTRVVFPLRDFSLSRPLREAVTADESCFRLLSQVILPLKPGLVPAMSQSAVLDVLRATIGQAASHSTAARLRWCQNAGTNIRFLRGALGVS